MKTFNLRKVDITGKQAYYLKIEYRNKDSEPCIRVFRESKSLSKDDISIDSFAPTELKQSPFFIKPSLNLELISI
jgi:hypothetical protein